MRSPFGSIPAGFPFISGIVAPSGKTGGKPGERVPVDGVITAGESSIDQSAITGESVPVSRKPGDHVFAGTINQDNALDVRMTRLARDNTLARVMRLVAEAQEQKSPAQRFTETFARRFVPAVLAFTIIVIVAPPLVFGWTWSASFYRAMLVVETINNLVHRTQKRMDAPRKITPGYLLTAP